MAVLDERTDRPALDVVKSLRGKLDHISAIPGTAMEKQQHRARLSLPEIFREVKVQGQFVPASEALVGHALGPGEEKLLPILQPLDGFFHRLSRKDPREPMMRPPEIKPEAAVSLPLCAKLPVGRAGSACYAAGMRFFPGLPSLVLAASVLSPLRAQDAPPAVAAQPDNSIRVSLESAYESWRRAMDAGDLPAWEATTAYSRQIEIRNRIVSQKLPFPQALFADPVASPSLGGLIPLGVLSTGDTATSTYFGKANFGDEPGVAISDNLLVLHFLREEGRWRFDNLRLVKLGGDGELLLQIRNSDFSFLRGEEFQPAPALPPIPQPVQTPALVAEAWVDATGYEVTITVNGHLTGTFRNVKATELVMGGVRRSGNQIRIQSKLLPDAGAAAPKVEVAIYAAEDPAGQAQRVYHYRPLDGVPPVVDAGFNGGQ